MVNNAVLDRKQLERLAKKIAEKLLLARRPTRPRKEEESYDADREHAGVRGCAGAIVIRCASCGLAAPRQRGWRHFGEEHFRAAVYLAGGAPYRAGMRCSDGCCRRWRFHAAFLQSAPSRLSLLGMFGAKWQNSAELRLQLLFLFDSSRGEQGLVTRNAAVERISGAGNR